MLFRLSDPLIETIYPATKMYVIHVCQTWLFSFVSFPESLSTEKRQLFKVEADLRDKITNLFNGIYISICLACFKWFEKTSKKIVFQDSNTISLTLVNKWLIFYLQ